MKKKYQYFKINQGKYSYLSLVMKTDDIMKIINIEVLNNKLILKKEEEDIKNLLKSDCPVISDTITIGVDNKNVNIIDESTLELDLNGQSVLIDGLKRILVNRDLNYEYLVNIFINAGCVDRLHEIINKNDNHELEYKNKRFNNIESYFDYTSHPRVVSELISSALNKDVFNNMFRMFSSATNEITIKHIAEKIMALYSETPEEDFKNIINFDILKENKKLPLRNLFIKREIPIMFKIIKNFFSVIFKNKGEEYVRENMLDSFEMLYELIPIGIKEGKLTEDFFKENIY